MSNLKDKVVLITGASSGFGEDAALLFAKEGCKVVLAARRMERLQALVEKIQNAGGEAVASLRYAKSATPWNVQCEKPSLAAWQPWLDFG
jgi:NADP-dependent 3-hydroxy acid dehydrogenase YdfG